MLTKRAQKYIKFVGFLSAVYVKVFIVTQETESAMHADKNMPSQHAGYKDTNAILFPPHKQEGMNAANRSACHQSSRSEHDL